MKINCISCGHKVDLDASYDEYSGLIRCFVCDAMLMVHTHAGKIKTVELSTDHSRPFTGSKNVPDELSG